MTVCQWQTPSSSVLDLKTGCSALWKFCKKRWQWSRVECFHTPLLSDVVIVRWQIPGPLAPQVLVRFFLLLFCSRCLWPGRSSRAWRSLCDTSNECHKNNQHQNACQCAIHIEHVFLSSLIEPCATSRTVNSSVTVSPHPGPEAAPDVADECPRRTSHNKMLVRSALRPG